MQLLKIVLNYFELLLKLKLMRFLMLYKENIVAEFLNNLNFLFKNLFLVSMICLSCLYPAGFL